MTIPLGTVGDALDNAVCESFVDTFKTELIADRVWQTRSQLELATVEWVSWFNDRRLHEALGDIPPVEYEQLHAAAEDPFSGDRSIRALSPNPADGLTTRRLESGRLETGLELVLASENGRAVDWMPAQTAPNGSVTRTLPAGLSAEIG